MSVRRLLGFAILLVATSAFAVAPDLFSGLRWRLLGPFRGGRVLAVTGVPSEPEHFYFGSVNGGVWETRDTGRTWTPIFDGQPVGSIGAIAIAPSNPRVIYVGSGEADMRSDIAQGDGMYKSTDGGKTWANIGLRDSQQIGRILVDPANPDLVYVAALGHPYGPNAERGVFRSRDGGKSWQKVLGAAKSGQRTPSTGQWDSDTGAIDLAFDPSNSRVIYASLWQTRRTPWSVYPPSSGPNGGLYKSTDGGDTWTMLGGGLPAKPGRIGVAVAPSRPQRVYAIVDVEKGGGMYRSDDGGATWVLTSSDPRVWGRGWYFGGVNVEPNNPDVVYSININVYRSDDAGKTFIPVKGAPGGDDYHQLWIDPQNPARRILGVDQGCVVSVNGGKTWSSWYNQPTGQFYHVITDNQFPYWVYGAQQDSGAAGIPSRTNTIDGINLMNFRESTAGGESDNVAPDPKDPDIIYGGRVEKLDIRSKQTQSVDPTLAYPENYRRTWTLPLVFSPRDPKLLYFANQRVFRTEDGGNHWSVISPDLTREDPGAPSNLDPVTAALKPGPGSRLGVVYTIAPSRVAANDIWVGTDDGLIWRTKDEGAHWTNVTPAALTPWSKVGIIEASHFDADTAYAAIDRHRLDDFKPYVYRTHDGGKTWEAIATGIPEGSFVNAVREDPVRKGLLYAGTEKGVYVSFDDGAQWQALQLNLPVTSIRDLDVHGNDLVIATHGRAFWALDDVTPLRQATEVAGSPHLFKAATAIRTRIAGFTGTPMPKDEAMAPNPPNGAYIDYIVPAGAPFTLEILDSSNNLVQRFSSTDPVPKANLQKLTVAPEWFVTPSTLKATGTMQRFVWPFHYAAPAALGAGRRGPEGVWAPPGEYTVVLTAGDKRLTQPLTLAPDPRVNLPAAAYAEQFALAKQVEAVRIAVATARNEAQAVIDAIGKSKAPSYLAKPLDLLQARASDISGIVPAANADNAWWMPPKTTTSLTFLSTALQSLAGAVDGADVAPTQDARESYAKLKAASDTAVASWNDFKAKDLAAFNERLKSAGVAPIAIR